MKTLTIEWRHYEKEGATCLRCSETGKTLQQVVGDLERELATQGVQVRFTETKLPESRLAESNMILFDGVPLEELLTGARSGSSECASCACLVGQATACRTVEHGGKTFEEIPEALVRQAAWRAAGLTTP